MKIIKNKKGIGDGPLILIVSAIIAISAIITLGTFTGAAFDAFTGSCSLRNPQTPEEVATCPTNTIVCQARNNYQTSGSFKGILASVCCCELDAVVDKSDPPAYLTDFNELGSMENEDRIPDEEYGDVFCKAGEVICGAQNADDADYGYDDAKDALSNLKCCPAKGIYVFRWDAEDVRILRDASDPGEVSACDIDEVVCAAKHDGDNADLLKYVWCCKYEEFEPRVDGLITWSTGDTYDFDAGGYLCSVATSGRSCWDMGEIELAGYGDEQTHYVSIQEGVLAYNQGQDFERECHEIDNYGESFDVKAGDHVCIKTRTGKYVLMEYEEITSLNEGIFNWKFQ